MSEERVAVTVFLCTVSAVYIFAGGALVRMILERTGSITTPPGKAQRWFRRTFLALAAVGILCMLYGYFIEPYRLTTRYVEIRTSKISSDGRPIRIAHISDMHSDPSPRLEEQLPEAIARENPDIIVFSGDSLNSPDGLPVFRNCLTQLAKIAPTFVVRGNWDAWYWTNIDLFGATGATELKSAAEPVIIRGTEIWVAGVPVGDEAKVFEVLDGIPRDKFSVFLYHYPDEIEKVAARGLDLYCAGHTHGGQIALPFYGALMTLSKYGKRFEAGTYRVGDTWLNVNRGIGMEGGTAPRVRFWAVPEITVIDLIGN
jgi:predicted MPP superfamily phosphohydrolase